MADSTLSDEARDFMRADLFAQSGVAATYGFVDGSTKAVTVARGEDELDEGVLVRTHYLSEDDVAAPREGETITITGEGVWAIRDAKTRPLSGFHRLACTRHRAAAR